MAVSLAGCAVALAFLFILQVPARAAPAGSPYDTVQTDGRVSAILLWGDRIYIAGNFRHVNGVPRTRLASMDAATGALRGWNPGANGAVYTLAASPDGTKIYAGGDFTSVGGVPHERLVALDPTTGRAVAGWRAGADGTVRTIAVAGNEVYLGGAFLHVDGRARTRLALVDGIDGSLAPNWHPSANNTVRKLTVSIDGTRIYAGGYFTAVSGQSRRYLATLSPALGTLLSWRPAIMRPVIDLVESGGYVFTAEGGTGGGAASAYDTTTGSVLWSRHADGDCQAVTVFDDEVFVGGHYDHFGGLLRRKFAAIDPVRGAVDPGWAPKADAGVWELTPDFLRGRLYAGGDFTSIGGQPQQGFASFSN
ncbi:PQQ-binding-like beta-propeller repeat protein [Rubrobacter calidifluminis]|uniref:PQQ-binding-like beta-propeller repeat protein n=1 Tax=Rubrobacter calidifluminis TaxID=1392640 RepID=UPI0023623286|nr:PQQ-binding-like beta-propeller repeat protein [Rubrobacter calidifluminis]